MKNPLLRHYYILTHRHVSGANGQGNQYCIRGIDDY